MCSELAIAIACYLDSLTLIHINMSVSQQIVSRSSIIHHFLHHGHSHSNNNIIEYRQHTAATPHPPNMSIRFSVLDSSQGNYIKEAFVNKQEKLQRVENLLGHPPTLPQENVDLSSIWKKIRNLTPPPSQT